jgi:hypothetical protein
MGRCKGGGAMTFSRGAHTFDAWAKEVQLKQPIELDVLDRQHVLDTLQMCLMWLDNLEMNEEINWCDVLNSMPNNTGGRGWVLSSIEILRGDF